MEINEDKRKDKRKRLIVRTVTDNLTTTLKSLKLLYYPLRFLYLTLLTLLQCRGSYDAVIIQTPPFLPTIIVAWACSWIYGRGCGGADLIVDWHNIGFTMFDEGVSGVRGIVKASERALGSTLPTLNLCVSNRMKVYLTDNFDLKPETVRVLHDRPTRYMRKGNKGETHDMWRGLNGELEGVRVQLDIEVKEGESVFTDFNGVRRVDSPLVFMSATSWTVDEDFGILLDALVGIDDLAVGGKTEELRNGVVVFVTGKGPMKEYYEGRVRGMGLRRVAVKTLWLETEDYPRLIGGVDAGISLHTSTSGVDLPMKILDMFGCGVPVLAMNFEALPELVEDGVNGIVFRDAKGLGEGIMRIARGEGRGLMREVEKGKRWEEEWDEVVWEGFVKGRGGRGRGRRGGGAFICPAVAVIIAVLVGVIKAWNV